MTLQKLAVAHLFALGLCSTQDAWAVCTTLIRGPVAIEVKQCAAVVPETTFASRDSKYSFIRDLPPANRKQFIETYRGALVSGSVIQSQAVRQGMSNDKGALINEPISAFIPAAAASCESVFGKTIEVELTQICCDGGGATPCLLDTSYVLNQVKVSDAKASGKAAASKRSPEIQALYSKAKKAVAARDLKLAARTFEEIRAKGELDVNGVFNLAIVYRELDKCPLALPLLEGLNRKFEAKDYWTDTEAAVRKGTFLYARCLSITGKTAESVLVLQGFLPEKARYRKEIADSLSHRDFGYVRTSKAYIKYKKAAEAALKAPDDEDNAQPVDPDGGLKF